MHSQSLACLCRCALLGAAALLTFPSQAQETESVLIGVSNPGLTLAEALRRTESRHPLFEGYRLRLAAADARTRQAGLRPAPELRLTVENALGTDRLQDFSAAETTLEFSQLIELGGLRDRRVAVAGAARAQLVGAEEIARLDQRAEVARRFVHLLSDQAQLAITREATRLTRDTLNEVERRMHSGRAPQAEFLRARISYERAMLEEEHAEHELLASRRHLAAATGVLEPDFATATGDLLRLPEVAAFDVLLRQLESSPEMQRFASEERLRASQLRLAQAARTPGIRLGAGIRHLNEIDDVGFLFSASVPLFSGSRQHGRIAEREAQLATVGPKREQALLLAQAQLYELWQELNHARTEVEVQRDRVVPAIRQALEQTRAAYRRGRYSLLELRDVQAEWARQRRRLYQAATEYHSHLIEIQRLTGRPAPPLVAVAQEQR